MTLSAVRNQRIRTARCLGGFFSCIKPTLVASCDCCYQLSILLHFAVGRLLFLRKSATDELGYVAGGFALREVTDMRKLDALETLWKPALLA